MSGAGELDGLDSGGGRARIGKGLTPNKGTFEVKVPFRYKAGKLSVGRWATSGGVADVICSVRSIRRRRTEYRVRSTRCTGCTGCTGWGSRAARFLAPKTWGTTYRADDWTPELKMFGAVVFLLKLRHWCRERDFLALRELWARRPVVCLVWCQDVTGRYHVDRKAGPYTWVRPPRARRGEEAESGLPVATRVSVSNLTNVPETAGRTMHRQSAGIWNPVWWTAAKRASEQTRDQVDCRGSH